MLNLVQHLRLYLRIFIGVIHWLRVVFASLQQNKLLTVYPNPTNDVLNLTAKQAIELQSVAIYNVLGQLVLSVPQAKGVSTVDVSNLTSGNYFLKVVTDKGISNTKFIKK